MGKRSNLILLRKAGKAAKLVMIKLELLETIGMLDLNRLRTKVIDRGICPGVGKIRLHIRETLPGRVRGSEIGREG